MDKTIEQTLTNLYNHLRTVIDEESKRKQLSNNSVYLFLVKKRDNDVIKLLIKCGIEKNLVDFGTIKYLLKKNVRTLVSLFYI